MKSFILAVAFISLSITNVLAQSVEDTINELEGFADETRFATFNALRVVDEVQNAVDELENYRSGWNEDLAGAMRAVRVGDRTLADAKASVRHVVISLLLLSIDHTKAGDFDKVKDAITFLEPGLFDGR